MTKLDTDDFKVMCVVKRWEHHTPSGGYDMLATAVGAEIVRRRTDRSLTRRIAARVWRHFSHPKPYMLDYRYEDWLTESYVLSRSSRNPPDVVHLLYGDEQLDLLLRKRHLLSCPLIATFHLPTNRVRERFENLQIHLLSGIDVAVVVATNQLEDFRKWLGADRVICIPHGINTDRFSPSNLAPQHDGVRLLTVGHHMRDWKTIGEIIEKCRNYGLAVRFDIVASEHRLSGSVRYDNVYFHKGVSEERLIQFYREADALLLPVLDATATNATLEALACGTPVISSSIGGMPDYVDESCGWLFKNGDVNRIFDLINNICEQPEIARSHRVPARNKALGFSWARVAATMRLVYAAAARRSSPQLVAADRP
jgi:glycosyltransferase involved in cell wall biosynthesis